MKLGFIGLGKMGSRMVLKLLNEGHEVVVWNRSQAPIQELQLKIKNEKLKISATTQDLVSQLSKPRVIWSMLPAGEPTQNILDEVSKFVEKGDIVIDGGNAHFTDTQKRSETFKAQSVKFLGIGVSGGLIAAENGYPLMVGGDKSAYDFIQPILESLSRPNGGFDYFGTGGAGHFVKMVHNAIEYGMMQAIGEGFGILEKSDYRFDLQKVAKLWQKGTIVSGFLIDRTADALTKDVSLSDISGSIPRGGEGDWAVAVAKDKKVPVSAIETSVAFRKDSEKNEAIQRTFAAKMVNALRHEFGGHEVKKK